MNSEAARHAATRMTRDERIIEICDSLGMHKAFKREQVTELKQLNGKPLACRATIQSDLNHMVRIKMLRRSSNRGFYHWVEASQND